MRTIYYPLKTTEKERIVLVASSSRASLLIGDSHNLVKPGTNAYSLRNSTQGIKPV